MSAQLLLDELTRLGGAAYPRATRMMIRTTEARLSLRLPPSLADFYCLCDGFAQPTTEWIWDFFPLERLSRLCDAPFGYDTLRLYGGSEHIAGRSLVAFCDVLIDAPTYAVCGCPDDPSYGHIFASQGEEGWRVARTFDEFVKIFVSESDDCLLNA